MSATIRTTHEVNDFVAARAVVFGLLLDGPPADDAEWRTRIHRLSKRKIDIYLRALAADHGGHGLQDPEWTHRCGAHWNAVVAHVRAVMPDLPRQHE